MFRLGRFRFCDRLYLEDRGGIGRSGPDRTPGRHLHDLVVAVFVYLPVDLSLQVDNDPADQRGFVLILTRSDIADYSILGIVVDASHVVHCTEAIHYEPVRIAHSEGLELNVPDLTYLEPDLFTLGNDLNAVDLRHSGETETGQDKTRDDYQGESADAHHHDSPLFLLLPSILRVTLVVCPNIEILATSVRLPTETTLPLRTGSPALRM